MSTIDPHGNLPENQFTEVLELQGNNSNRIYILDHAPFYSGAVLQLKGTPNPLREGVDYNLVYRVEELKGSVARDLYNGIELLIDITGSLIVVGQMYDRGFKKPLTDLATEMLRYLNEPIKTSYNNIEELPSIFPPKPTYRPWYNIGNKQYIASSVDDVETSVTESSNDLTVIVEELKQRTIRLRESMVAVNVPDHIENKNPHIVTLAQLKAHPVNMAAADTALAYGYDVLELVRLIRESGLSDADIDRHISNHGASGIEGVFSFADGVAKIKTEDGKSSLSLNDGSFVLETDGVVVLRAGYTKLANKYLELITGVNTLRFESSGVDLDDSKITLNGVEFITVSTVFDFNPEEDGGSDETIELVYTSDNVLTVSGRGSPTVPLSVEFTPPPAGENVEGTLLIGDLLKSPNSYTAVPANAVVRANNLLVPQTWKINNKPLTNNIVITKADLGLGSVDNTADLDKPISNPQMAEINKLSNLIHNHSSSELTIDLATDDATGKSRVANSFEEFEDIQKLIDGLPEEGDPTSDVNNSLFGITDVFFEQLKKFFIENAPDPSDMFDMRKLVMSAASSVELTVSDSTITAVEGGRYLIPTTKSTGPSILYGKINGSVDLRSVTNRNWHSGASTFESTFNKCNLISASTGNGAVIEPSKTFAPNAGLKLRFDTDEETVEVFYRTNSGCECRINGSLEDLTVNADSTLSKKFHRGSHVMSFVFDAQTDVRFNARVVATNMMGVQRVIYETTAESIFSYYSLDKGFDGRYFIYVTGEDGKIYAMNGMNHMNNVSKVHLYLGYLDVKNGVVVGNGKIKFNGSVNYGPIAELNEHSRMAGAHSLVNVNIPGLDKMPPAGEMNAEVIRGGVPSLVWTDTGTWTLTDVVRRDVAARFKLTSTANVGLPRRTNMFIAWKTKNKSPAQFRSYKNALLNQRLGVYEGCFQMYTHTRAALKNFLVFLKLRADKKHDVLMIDLNNDEHVVFIVSGLTETSTAQRARESQRSLPCDSTRVEVACSSVSGGTYKSGNLNIDPVGHVTYRYDINKKTFYITSIKPGILGSGETGRVAVTRTIKFNENLDGFFKSDYVGLCVEATPSNTTSPVVDFGIAASPFPIPPELGDYRHYIDYDELFKTYLLADTVEEYTKQNNGMWVESFPADPYAVNAQRQGATGFFGDTELGTVFSSCEYTFPIFIMPTSVPSDESFARFPASHCLTNPDFRWLNIGKIPTTNRYGYQMGVVAAGGGTTTIPRRIDLSIDLMGLWGLANSGNTTLNIDLITNSKIDSRVIVEPTFSEGYNSVSLESSKKFTIAKPVNGPTDNHRMLISLTMNGGSDFIFKIEGSFTGGNTVAFNFDSIKPFINTLRVVPSASGVIYYTPWHITQKTWDWYNTIAKNKL